ncbi:MAG: hypothetical protein DWH91_13185 [Planctomycetota bacterium]|nr:MAG: hypothetical protein DWH91_13185 [Planctomycetota bacterium]
MSTGKKKKSKKSTSSGNGFPVRSIILGLILLAVLIAGGMWLAKQRQAVVGYDESIAKITEALRSRDPESAQGPLQLSEVAALLSGNPETTRETKDGSDYAVYTWPGNRKVGFRLKLEKNGPTDEVVELATLNAE